MMRVPFTWPCASVSAPSGSTRSTSAMKLASDSAQGSRCSGRTPSSTSRPFSFDGIRFIGGEPMKPATNVVAGFA